MPKTIGDDLRKRVLGRDDEVIIKKSKRRRPELVQKSVLLNPKRRELFEYLCRRPCSHLERIAKTLKYPSTTVKWHLQKLIENGFINRDKMGNTTIYYPLNLVDSSDLEALTLLSSEKIRHILRCVSDSPGITQKDLAKIAGISPQMVIWHTMKLDRLGIIAVINDGKYTIYNETEFLAEHREYYRKRVKAFKEFILKKLSNEGLNPQVYRAVADELRIQIGKGRKRFLIILNVNPFAIDVNM